MARCSSGVISSDIFCNAIGVRFVFEVREGPSAKLSSAELST